MRIGVIGGGQLGQMLGFAARELNHPCYFLDPSDDPPARSAGPVIQAAFDDPVALAVLAEKCDVMTYEFENVPVDTLVELKDLVTIYPPPEALRQAQDRLDEKKLFESLDIGLPAYRTVDSLSDLERAADAIGLPFVLKTRRMGYDGKGQWLVREREDIAKAWTALGSNALIAEQWIDFDFEVSAIGVRGTNGETATYCLTRNEHSQGILRVSKAPVEDPDLAAIGIDYMERLLDNLDYIGVLALEMFVVGDTLLANEFAPRVHNSGHWTIEGAHTSQFSNHVRAITGQALGATDIVGHAGMLNLIGEIPHTARWQNLGQLHDYGKVARPGRKLGHLTVVARTAAERDDLLTQVSRIVTNVADGFGTAT